VFFYNPNITDETEYGKRLKSQKKFIDKYNSSKRRVDTLDLIEGEYEPDVFLSCIKGHESDKEGGDRCRLCFELRLEKTAAYASMHGFEVFTTAMSVSPHKNHADLLEIGNRIALRYGIRYLADDFKKKGGYLRSSILANAYDLYRQNYCGCAFSKKDGDANP
jgi:predicted adenine nucleotide alpha hydrolase (AANH) superfamily ATPase